MKNQIKSYPFAKKNISKIVFVSGNTRSGKALVLKIIASLKGVQKSNVNFTMEQANFLTHTKDISKKAAIYFLRRSFSILDYNLRIGRDVNLRKNDFHDTVIPHQNHPCQSSNPQDLKSLLSVLYRKEHIQLQY